MRKYHIITQDADNPLQDKRCRYGMKKLAKLKTGSIITEHIEPMEVAGIKFESSSYRMMGDWIPKEIFLSLPTKPHELDALETFDMEFCGYRHEDMIRAFLKEGKITIEQIREYFEREEE